jgi:hypothetical protein
VPAELYSVNGAANVWSASGFSGVVGVARSSSSSSGGSSSGESGIAVTESRISRDGVITLSLRRGRLDQKIKMWKPQYSSSIY